MIKVTVGNTTKRKELILEPSTTLRSALEQADINYTAGTTTLDGSPVQRLDATFDEMGITEKCYLMNIVKADSNR